MFGPDTLDRFGEAAPACATEPDAAATSHVPDSQDVLSTMPIIAPRQSGSLKFQAPTAPGDYPCVCTFPEHWQAVRAFLRVEG